MMRARSADGHDWLKAAEVARISRGRLLHGDGDARRVTTDTRDLQRGDCFVALQGDRFDGHDHALEALARGAAGVIVSKRVQPDAVPAGCFVVEVDDTFEALAALATECRRRSGATVVGITGSCGKTTTKEMLGHVLASAMPVVRSPRSFNNRIGVPLTLFQLQPDTAAAVVEIGTNGPGEIAQLTAIAEPDIAIVTCVAESHLEGLGSIRGVAREKASLVAGVRAGGVAILNGDDPACLEMASAHDARPVMVRVGGEADWFATDVEVCGMSTAFRLQGDRRVVLPVLGIHNVYNALLTIAAAVELGMELDVVLAALSRVAPARRRLQPVSAGDVTIFDDTYNMNPASARAGLDALCGLPDGGRRVAVFGGMAELGASASDLHRALGEHVARSGVDLLVTVGNEALGIAKGARDAGMASGRVHCAPTVAAAEGVVRRLVVPSDRVLCKASRRYGLDQLVDRLVALAEEPRTSREEAAGGPSRAGHHQDQMTSQVPVDRSALNS